jgi:lipoate-protein ligase A
LSTADDDPESNDYAFSIEKEEDPGPLIPIWDDGLRDGAWNAVFDRSWLALHAAGRRPPLLRFHRSSPTASIGLHQAIDRELRLDYCERHGIGIVRRASGGGALYLDENQQGISLILTRPLEWQDWDAAAILESFCEALVFGLSRLRVNTAFKAPNDLEIDGRKLASAFLASQGDALLLHATVLLDADIRTMLEALRAPTEKLSPSGLDSARERLVTLKERLGEEPEPVQLQIALLEGLSGELALAFSRWSGGPSLEPEQEASFARHIDWGASGANTLEAVWKTAGGTLRVRVELDEASESIRHVQFAGDVHILPADSFATLEQFLAGAAVAGAGDAVIAFYRDRPADMLGFTPEDVRQVLQLALDKSPLRETLGLNNAQANSLMVYSPDPGDDAQSILDRATVMLVPYCAKPSWCKWRHQDDCVECGKCEVGDAYHMARERNMQVTTITHYEHLVTTLEDMKAAGTPAYVGMCCGSFFIKRHRAFRDAGMPTVLMDINGATCYELKQENLAYAGTFQAEARLDLEVLRQVMRKVPGVGRRPGGDEG